MKAPSTTALSVLLLQLVASPALAAPTADAVLVDHGPSRAQAVAPPLRLAKAARAEPLATLLPAAVGAREQVEAIAVWNRAGMEPVKNGFVRDLAIPRAVRLGGDLLGKSSGSVGGGTFRTTSGGLVWGAAVRVEGAHRLRLRLDRVALPPTAELWVYGERGDALRFGTELVRAEGDLWTPSVAGEVICLELRLEPAALGSAAAELTVAAVAEIFALDEAGAPVLGQPTRDKDIACIQDATCFDDSALDGLSLYKEAVAQLQFMKGDSSFLCSGALLNDTDESGFIPYLLTAYHCFSTAGAAATLESFFDYLTPACGGSWPDLASLPRVAGATLVATSPTVGGTDSTFVRLSEHPGGSVGYLGWDPAPLEPGTDLFRLSHPAPFGSPFPQVLSTTKYHDPPATCAEVPAARFAYSVPTLGGTAGGSSGAPTVDADLRVRGQLRGACGPDPEDPCDFRNNETDGRFSELFPRIARFLDPSAEPCMESDTVLCVDAEPGDRRFRVSVSFDTVLGGGRRGESRQVSLRPQGVTQGGVFAFFDPRNPEMLVKVLNFCSFNGHFWVFYAATTNVGFELTVEDTAARVTKTYTNPDLMDAQPVIDTAAFATCP